MASLIGGFDEKRTLLAFLFTKIAFCTQKMQTIKLPIETEFKVRIEGEGI